MLVSDIPATILSDVLSVALPVMTSVITILVGVWSMQGKHAIEWGAKATYVYRDLLNKTPDEAKRKMMLDGVRIDNLVQYEFVLRNSGSEAFDQESIAKPLVWTCETQIHSSWVESKVPPNCVDLQLCVLGNSLEIRWLRAP